MICQSNFRPGKAPLPCSALPGPNDVPCAECKRCAPSAGVDLHTAVCSLFLLHTGLDAETWQDRLHMDHHLLQTTNSKPAASCPTLQYDLDSRHGSPGHSESPAGDRGSPQPETAA